MSAPLFYLADVTVMPPAQVADQPLDFSAWTVLGGATVTGGFVDPDGGTNGYRIAASTSTGDGRYLVVTCASDGPQTVQITVKQDTATAINVAFYNNTSSAMIGAVRLDFDANGVPTAGQDLTNPYPTNVSVRSAGAGWWTLTYGVENVTAANEHWIILNPSRATGSLATYFYCANVWSAPLAMPRTSSTGYATITLRFANRHFITSSADTPANTMWDARLKQPVVVSRDAWNGGRTTGRSRTAYGDLVLLNGDGALDYLLYCGVDARALTVKYSTLVAPTYVSGFTNLFTGTMAGVEVGGDTVTIKVRDRQSELDVPLQDNVYAGDNVLPAGLEGVDDLKDSPKPLVFGQVTNLSPPQVNTSRLIYQVNDGPIFALSAVYDRGIKLGGNAYSAVSLSGTFTTYACRDMAEGPNGNLILTGGRVDYSTDGGSSWAASDTSGMGTIGNQLGAAFGASVFAVMESSLANASNISYIWTAASASGPWTAHDVASALTANNYTVQKLEFIDGRFVATYGSVTAAAVLLHSTDGSAWTPITTVTGFDSAGEYIFDMAYGAGLYVFVGNNGRVSYSPDLAASNFTEVSALPFAGGGTGDLKAIEYALGYFIVVGSDGGVHRSRDGHTWTQSNAVVPDIDTELQALAYGAGRLETGAAYIGPTPPHDYAPILLSGDSFNWYTVAHTNFSARNINGAFYSTVYNRFFMFGDSGECCSTTGPIVSYSTLTDIQDDSLAPPPGTVKVISVTAGAYFRLGSAPAGTITADVIQGASAGNRTVGGVFSAIMVKAGVTNYNTYDVSALDVATSAACGLFLDSERNVSDVLEQIAQSVGAWWGGDIAGTIRMRQLVAPQPYPAYAPEVYVTRDDLLAPVERVVANDVAIPPYKVIARWGKVYTVQDDLAGGAEAAHRAIVCCEFREQAASDTAVQTKHPLAPVLTIDTLFATAAGASSEASRVLTLRKVQRDTVRIVVPLNEDTAILDLSFQVLLTYPRYGFDSGTMLRVVAVEPDVARGTLTLTLWR